MSGERPESETPQNEITALAQIALAGIWAPGALGPDREPWLDAAVLLQRPEPNGGHVGIGASLSLETPADGGPALALLLARALAQVLRRHPEAAELTRRVLTPALPEWDLRSFEPSSL